MDNSSKMYISKATKKAWVSDVTSKTTATSKLTYSWKFMQLFIGDWIYVSTVEPIYLNTVSTIYSFYFKIWKLWILHNAHTP